MRASAAGAGGPASAARAPELAAYLSRERERVGAALDRCLEALATRIPERLAEVARHGIRGGGKRLRPVLCAAAYHAAGGAAGEGIYDVAVSLELIHAYSLMHDDLPCMDDAELRRGRSATHRVHGTRRTALAGASLIPLAVHQALVASRSLGLDEPGARAVARELAAAAGAGGMVGGQVLDLLAESEPVDAAGLDTVHALKTGALLRASLRMGARAAGAGGGVLAALDAYGAAVGLAFQITDDLLDATASVQALGKNPSDRALRKSTYVSLHGLERARARAVREVARARRALEGAGLTADRSAAAPLHALAGYAAGRRS